MNWRHTYNYTRAELIEYIREILSNTFPNNWLHKRDVLLQATERNLIQIPNYNPENYHKVDVTNIVVIENLINQEKTK